MGCGGIFDDGRSDLKAITCCVGKKVGRNMAVAMAAFQQYGDGITCGEVAAMGGKVAHVFGDRQAQQHIRFRQIGGDEGGFGEDCVGESGNSFPGQQFCAAGRDHDRIDHQCDIVEKREHFCDNPDAFGIQQHPCFNGFYCEIFCNTAHLIAQHLRGGGLNAAHTMRILRG